MLGNIGVRVFKLALTVPSHLPFGNNLFAKNHCLVIFPFNVIQQSLQVVIGLVLGH
jgi:hypothetical protein